jgi:hypothetical protein
LRLVAKRSNPHFFLPEIGVIPYAIYDMKIGELVLKIGKPEFFNLFGFSKNILLPTILFFTFSWTYKGFQLFYIGNPRIKKKFLPVMFNRGDFGNLKKR